MISTKSLLSLVAEEAKSAIKRLQVFIAAPHSRREYFPSAHNSQVKYTRRVNEASSTEKKPRPENWCQMRENDLQVQKRDIGAESKCGGTEDDEEILTQPSCAESVTVNRLNPNMVLREHDVSSRKITDTAVRILDEAIVYHQSDKIVSVRRRVEDLFQILSRNQAYCFKDPTKYGLEVLKRGRKHFLEEGVSCSIKHGTLLLDSSTSGAQLKHGTLVLDSITSGAQFYSGLLNVLAAFALLISEFEIAQKTSDLLLQLHHQSKKTSHVQDLAAAHNNMGCVHLIMGDFPKAEEAFKTSLEKFCHSECSSTETKVFAVNSNVSRLNLISKKYCEALEQQEKLVKICRATERKDVPYPFEVVFTVMNNQAVLHTTLGDFNRAENALRWLITYCKEMNRKDSVYLVTFLRLHLSEVLLLHGKPKEADEVFSIETLNSLEDVVDRFGNLYMNVRIVALEKLLAVYICKGKIKTALRLLQTSLKVLKSVFGEDHFNVAFLLYKQGKILSLAGEFPSAAAKFESSSQILQQIFGVKNHLLLKCYLYLGDLTSILGQKDGSYVYYQRAAESIEAIFQVSFVEELSIKYMEIIGGYKTFQRQRVSEDGIEGLVAEYGHVLAILLNHDSNSHLRKRIADGKEVTVKKMTRLCSISRSTLSLKCSLDFLKSGRKLLRYGMIKEAVVFFQQADMYCGVNAMQGYPDVSVARLHNIFLQRKFKRQETLKLDRNLRDFMKALGKVIQERSSESIVEETSGATPTVESDNNLDLKPVLISLLLFCIERKMIETTFEAYDLYCKLFQNETDSPFLLLDGIQVYASRTVITCNGKTALQDILIFSEIGLNASDVVGDAADTQLFRSLAYMENAPRNAFLVASKSPVFLDVDDLHSLKEKITLAVQECFQRTCFEAENKSHAMQVILDLTPTVSCGLQDILRTDSRIDLLPLCLSELPSDDTPYKKTIFEIETSMCQRITQVKFKDEQTSCFMFRKVALNLLQQNDTERISSILAQNHSFSLTVLHPGKARLVMSRREKLITQKIQFVTTRTTITKYMVPSVTLCETNSNSNHGWKGTKSCSQVYKGETAVPSEFEVEDRQKQRREKLVECLMTVSQISRLLYSVESPVTHDDICLADPDQCHNAHESLEDEKCISRENKVSLGDLGDDDARRLAASFQTQEDQENTSSTHQHLTESSEGNENNKRTLNVPNINTVETSKSNHGDESMPREDVCEILEGKRLFEDDRKSRRFFMADLQKSLKDKQQGQLNSNKGESIQSNRADPYDVSKLQSSHMQNDSNCGNLEVPHENPEAQEPSPTPTSRNVSTQENSLRISSLEGKTAKEDDKLMTRQPSPQSPAPNNVGDRNDFEDVSSRLLKTTLEKETPLAASKKSDGSSLLERKPYAENVETARNDVRSSTQSTIKTNRQTPSHSQEVQDTLRVDEKEERQAKPSINNFKRRKRHIGEGSERNEVEITAYGTNTPENQETPRPDYDDKATLKTFGSVPGEVFPVGSMNNGISESQNNVVDLLNETHSVDGPNLQEENGMHSTKKRELTIHSKSLATISICNKTTPRFLCQGGDVNDGESHKDLAVDASVLAKHSDKDNLDFVFVPNHEVEDAIGVDREGQRQTKPDVSKFNIRKQDLEGRERSGAEITRRKNNTLEKQGTSCSDHKEMTTGRTFEALGSNQSNVVDFPRQTDFVDGPKSKEENGTQSLNQGSRVIDPISSYGQIHVKSQATISNHYETSARSICQGGDVVADGEINEDNLNNFDTGDGPALTQNPLKAFNAGERFTADMKHQRVISCSENESHTDRDALCEHRYPLKSKTDLFQSHSDDGGARPKQRSTDNAKCPLPWPSVTNPVSAYCDFELENPDEDPIIMTRHVKESSPFPSFHYGASYNHASLDDPWQEDYEQEYSSSNAHDQVLKGKGQNSPDKKEFIPHDITQKYNMSVPVYNASVTKNFSFNQVSPPDGNDKESWHFPSSESWENRVPRSQCFAERTNESNPTSLPKSFDANREKLFNTCRSVCAYNDMDSMANEYSSSIANDECGQSLPFSENEHSSTEHSLASSFRCLQEIMSKTIRLIVSNATGAGETQPANQSVEKTGVQEETGNMGGGELTVTQQVNETNTQVESTPSNETTIEAERQPMATPVQESPRPVCSHYQRRCLVRFPCCGKFFPCHRCHNESDCSEDQARAINATHIRCTICYHEQEIDENSQRCGGCNAIMSEYFCSTCRHYTSMDKNPFHCEKCGICRIHRDRSFHCDVCNVCLDKRLEGKHKCRPDSGHDECCICLEDAFSGCQILPCSHKVHKDCAIAMIQNGVRKCPICRHPLFGQLQTSSQN